MPQNKPLYIVFEGGEGCGKSTQARLLVDAIGETAVLTREPGGTPRGVELRDILLEAQNIDIDPVAEAFLMAADRAQHMAEVVRPALESKRLTVVSDRSLVSSIAYQGAGRGTGEEFVRNLNLMIPGLKLPDIMFILSSPPKAILGQRLARELDRLEQANDDFHANVSLSFGQMAHFLAADGRTEGIYTVTINPIDGSRLKTVQEIHGEVTENLQIFCDEKGYSSVIPSSSS
jgi:dTMP kinase